ncbi:MAG: Smr/MutS family protein [Nannocystaceae bacterium]
MPKKRGRSKERAEAALFSMRERLAPHLRALSDAAERSDATGVARRQAREVERATRRLTEGELMQLAFERAGDGAAGLELDRIVIVRRRVAPHEARPTERARLPAAALSGPAPARVGAASELQRQAWAGKSWGDHVDGAIFARASGAEDRRRLGAALRAPQLPQLNLRRLAYPAALTQLARFVALCREQGCSLLRVIPGKGINSPGEPVIKPAVEDWCRARLDDLVAGWSPEYDEDGSYGSIIVELCPGPN